MAKSGKIVQLFQKPENFIRSRARQLKLGKCYISADWEESGIANVLVTRKHDNGNFTLGIYLVDLKCLGIKDAIYKFNIPLAELEQLVDYIQGEEIDYNKAHNIIYGAEAFAESCGFKPHKDWNVSQYILEEDNDQVPLMDISFGEDGLPVYYAGPYDTPAKINQILTTLDKNVGPGNYLFFQEDDDPDEELFSDHKFPEGEGMSDFKQIYFNLIADYLGAAKFSTETDLDKNLLEEILDEMVVPQYYIIDEGLENEIIDLVELHEAVFEEKSEENIDQVQSLLVQHPDNPYLYAALFLQYKAAGLEQKARETAKKGMTLFPEFLYLRFQVALAAMIDNELEKGLDLLNNQYHLNQAFPQRTAFSETEFMLFYAALCHYFVARGELNDAIVCSDLLIDNIYTEEHNENAVFAVMQAAKNRLNG